jgi:hypothetical protein
MAKSETRQPTDGDEKSVAADNSGDEKVATPNYDEGGHCRRFPFSAGRRN